MVLFSLFLLRTVFPINAAIRLYRVGPYDVAARRKIKAFIGIGSAVIFWLLTLMNNTAGWNGQKLLIASAPGAAYLVPSAILILLAQVWLCTGHQMTDHTGCEKPGFRIRTLGYDRFFIQHDVCVCRTGGRPDDCQRTRNPQRDFSASDAVSPLLSLGIHMVGTGAKHALPAGKTDIVCRRHALCMLLRTRCICRG